MPSAERPFDLFDALLRPSSERPRERSEALPKPRSTPTPDGGPPLPPDPRPPPTPPPLPRPCANPPVANTNTSRHKIPICVPFCTNLLILHASLEPNFGGWNKRREHS